MVQVGLDDGTETPIWHAGKSTKNLYYNNTRPSWRLWVSPARTPYSLTVPTR